jgi:Ca2+-transporting ATPase
MVGMEDPPREGAKKSIEKCKKAGIKVVMITGDNKYTASALGQQIGLLDDGLVISGSELDNMDDVELQAKINRIQVFARTSPEQKYRIVRAFKKSGFVVAMTGDGVNDAPAMKEANIGIAIGGEGSDVAKDAAAITLVDDNFDTIVSAIEEGRGVSNNIKSAMKYLLAGSLGEVIALTLTSGVCGMLPLLSIQILWVNAICETLLGAPLAAQTPSKNVMEQLPANKDVPLIDGELGFQIGRRGLGIGVSTFGVFEVAMLLGFGLPKSRSIAFSNLILAQLVNVYDCKNDKGNSSSMFMTTAAISSFALLMSIVYVPSLNSLFGTVPLLLPDWALIGTGVAVSRI